MIWIVVSLFRISGRRTNFMHWKIKNENNFKIEYLNIPYLETCQKLKYWFGMRIPSKPTPLLRDALRSGHIYHYGSYNTIRQMAIAIDSKLLGFPDLSAPGDVLCSVQWMPQFATPTRAIAESFNYTKLIRY